MAIHEEARRGFQAGASAYERGRPGYPRPVIDWLCDQLDLHAGRTVVDVGAGTGKLTRELVASGADVVAVEPVPAMRGVLEDVVPQARVLDGAAEVEHPSEQELDVEGMVDRVGSTSFIAALPGHERDQVLDRVRRLAAGWPPPLRLGYTTEAYVYRRR